MRSAELIRGALAALVACAVAAPALAGGALYVVPANGVMKPARWAGKRAATSHGATTCRIGSSSAHTSTNPWRGRKTWRDDGRRMI